MPILIKNIIYFTIISSLFSYEPFTIQGTVLDLDKNPLNDVYISSENDRLYSNDNGNFILLYKTDNEIVTFERLGYQTKKIQIKEIKKNNEISLSKEIIKYKEIKISALTGDIDKHNSSSDVHLYSQKNINSEENHFQDLLNQIPNFNFAGASSRPRYFQIRGIGERSQYAGEGGPMYYIGTMIDNIDISGIGMPLFLNNIQQIEIHQGAQSYAYGNNSMGGLINIKTLDPSSQKNQKIQMMFGNNGKFNFSIYNNLKSLNHRNKSNVFMNYSINYNKDDGFITNTYLNKKTNKKNELNTNAKLLFNANQNLLSKLTILHAHLDNDYDIWAPDNNGEITYSNEPGKDSQKLNAASIEHQLKINKNIKIIHLMSTLKSKLEHSYDSDWGNFDFWNSDPYNWDSDYYGYEYEFYQKELRTRKNNTSELRLITKFSNFSNSVGYYTKNLNEQDEAIGWILGGEDIHLNSRFNIATKGFYTETKTDNKNNHFNLTINTRTESINLNYLALHTHSESIGDSTYINKNILSTLNAARVSFLYAIDDFKNIYINVANGFKHGGINQNPRLNEENKTFDPEFNNNLDFGYRYNSKELKFNLNIFIMQRTNIQTSISTQQEPENPNSFYYYTSNASNGKNHGLNMDLNLNPTEDLDFYFNMGLLNTQINSYEYYINDTLIINMPQREAAHAPSYTFSGGFTKKYQDLFWGVNVQGKNWFYFSDSHDEKSKPYSILNLHLGKKINSNMTFSLWAKNVLNTRYEVRGFYFTLEPDQWTDKLYTIYGEPLSIGLTFNYNL